MLGFNMGCKHERRIATRRVLSNGAVTISLQCQRCGSGLAAKKFFDDSLPDKYREELMSAWKDRERLLLSEQENRSSEWWTKYNLYLCSDHWRAVRKLVLLRDQLCQRCFMVSSWISEIAFSKLESPAIGL